MCVRACVRACLWACVCACVRACVRACVCMCGDTELVHLKSWARRKHDIPSSVQLPVV